MNNRAIADNRGHRPIPFPDGFWAMKQVWRELMFAHWPVREADIAPHIPGKLQLERREGKPWISVAPFRFTGVRLRGLPPLPFASRSLELNVRTYVTCNGVPGIYFLSLDASNRLAVEAARWFRLPYLRAQMKLRREGEHMLYSSRRLDRRAEPAEFLGICRADGDVFEARPGTVLHWLTERYRMYLSDRHGKIFAIDIHHGPWKLRRAELAIERNTMAECHGIALPERPPLTTFTERMDVLVWPIKPV